MNCPNCGAPTMIKRGPHLPKIGYCPECGNSWIIEVNDD